MATAGSNLAYIRVVPETVFGTIPSTGNPTGVRFTGESLKLAIQTDTSKEIRADRQVADLIQLGADTSGDINFELSYKEYDLFLSAALGTSWAAIADTATVEEDYGVTLAGSATASRISNGLATPFFTIEKGFTDVTQFLAYRGTAVNTMNLEFNSAAILTGSFGFMGKDGILNSVATNLTGSAAVSQTFEPMNTSKGIGKVMVDGAALPGTTYIQSLKLNVNNSLRALKAVGVFGAAQIKNGTQLITGTAEVYFSDGSLYKKFLDNESIQLAWAAHDATVNGYGFQLPRVKFTDGTIVAGGLDQDVMVSLPFQALLDPTTGKSIFIDRFGI